MLHPNQQQPIFKVKNFLFGVGKNNALETFSLIGLPYLATISLCLIGSCSVLSGSHFLEVCCFLKRKWS